MTRIIAYEQATLDDGSCEWLREFGLTLRECAVVELVVRGLHNREVADVLGVSPITVRNHLASVFRKASVTTRTELAFICMQRAPGTDSQSAAQTASPS